MHSKWSWHCCDLDGVKLYVILVHCDELKFMMNNFCYCLKAAQQNLPEEHTSELTASLCSKKNQPLIINKLLFHTSIMDFNKGHDGMFMLNKYNEKTKL